MNCNNTCPEDCAKNYFATLKHVNDSSKTFNVKFGCSTFPNISQKVESCKKDFNYTSHPNANELPKTCGKQKSGLSNSVILLEFFIYTTTDR